MLDERSREVDAPKECRGARNALATHVSDQLLVLRIGATAAAPSYCVFSRMAKGALKKDLDNEYSVYGVEELLGK